MTPYWKKGDLVTICAHPEIHPLMHGQEAVVENPAFDHRSVDGKMSEWAKVRLDGDRKDHWVVECPAGALMERSAKPEPPPEPTDLELVVKWLRDRSPIGAQASVDAADAIERGDWKPLEVRALDTTTAKDFLAVIGIRTMALRDRMKDSNRAAYVERIAELESLATQVRMMAGIPLQDDSIPW